MCVRQGLAWRKWAGPGDGMGWRVGDDGRLRSHRAAHARMATPKEAWCCLFSPSCPGDTPKLRDLMGERGMGWMARWMGWPRDGCIAAAIEAAFLGGVPSATAIGWGRLNLTFEQSTAQQGPSRPPSSPSAIARDACVPALWYHLGRTGKGDAGAALLHDAGAAGGGGCSVCFGAHALHRIICMATFTRPTLCYPPPLHDACPYGCIFCSARRERLVLRPTRMHAPQFQ